MPADDPTPYTVAEAAAMLHCEPGTVEDWLRCGRLTGIKAGRSWVLPRGAFLRRLDELAEAEAQERRMPAAVAAATAGEHGQAPRRQRRKLPRLVSA